MLGFQKIRGTDPMIINVQFVFKKNLLSSPASVAQIYFLLYKFRM